MAFGVRRALIVTSAVLVNAQLLLQPPGELAKAIEDAHQAICDDVNSGMEVQTAISRICPEVERRFPLLKEFSKSGCEALVWTSFSEHCSKGVSSTTTTTTHTSGVVQAKPKGLGEFLAALPWEKMVPVVQKATGLPSGHELICKSLNNSALETHAQDVLCGMMSADLGGDLTMQTCENAISFAWKQEATEEGCPGAPEGWAPFHFLNGLAQKMMCFELKSGKLVGKEKSIAKKICTEISDNDLDHWACEMTIESILKNFEKHCSDHPVVDIASDVISQASTILV